MKEETKMEISAALTLLKNTLIKNGVSIALAGSEDAGEDDGRILFLIRMNITEPEKWMEYQ